MTAYSYDAELQTYEQANPRSAARFAEAQEVLAGGNSRLTAYFAPFPFYVDRAEGGVLYDIDGNARLDFYNNATSLILGHANPQVTAALIAQAEKGTAYSVPANSKPLDLLSNKLNTGVVGTSSSETIPNASAAIPAVPTE